MSMEHVLSSPFPELKAPNSRFVFNLTHPPHTHFALKIWPERQKSADLGNQHPGGASIRIPTGVPTRDAELTDRLIRLLDAARGMGEVFCAVREFAGRIAGHRQQIDNKNLTFLNNVR